MFTSGSTENVGARPVTFAPAYPSLDVTSSRGAMELPMSNPNDEATMEAGEPGPSCTSSTPPARPVPAAIERAAVSVIGGTVVS